MSHQSIRRGRERREQGFSRFAPLRPNGSRERSIKPVVRFCRTKSFAKIRICATLALVAGSRRARRAEAGGEEKDQVDIWLGVAATYWKVSIRRRKKLEFPFRWLGFSFPGS